MEFQSLEETFLFYNQYARKAGFSARLGNSKKNKRTNEVEWKQFICFKEGHTDYKREKEAQVNSVKERARGEVRTGCREKLSLVKEQTDPNWIVTKIMESHNHPLSTPSKIDSGVPEHLGCTERDTRDFERELRDEQKGIDTETLIEIFAMEKEKNSTFFNDYETDSTERFTR
ncbi:protein FAR1-RELATED SEQUENCE 5-like [Zingiber officinale]|uniref:protein FAR1-RELATED SEQUENCE 5-like n=1 Tax=Zingiber officinale TaxID=94328 RepID=UPI001C4B4773|nr:protein FAR1-RELATED SEQUENCE 5-like [Zingiber officinale]